jgi:hypothetical protein
MIIEFSYYTPTLFRSKFICSDFCMSDRLLIPLHSELDPSLFFNCYQLALSKAILLRHFRPAPRLLLYT